MHQYVPIDIVFSFVIVYFKIRPFTELIHFIDFVSKKVQLPEQHHGIMVSKDTAFPRHKNL